MNHTYEYSYENVTLRPLRRGDIESLRVWRNRRENTRYLQDVPYITEEMQQAWFLSRLSAEDELYFAIVETRDLRRLVGSLALYHLRAREAEFGKILIGDDMAHGKRAGRNATIAALGIAFRLLGLETVKLKVYEENRAAVKVYSQAGFRVVETRRDSGGRNKLFMEARRKDMAAENVSYQPSSNAAFSAAWR